MQLLIFYLTNNRRHYTFSKFIEMLNMSQKKDQWKLLILTNSHDENFYIENLKQYNDMNYDTTNVEPDNNYLRKVNFAGDYAKKNNIPYVMKCDNDIFLKAQTLDFMIDNLHLLENTTNLTIGPVLTSGIPGIELFIEQFLDHEAKKKIEELFLQTKFYNRDGAIYDFLNKHTLNATEWKKEEFFESVKSMNHHYKGIHPIRINETSLQFLNEYIIKNKDRFLQNNNELSIIDNNNSPYLCNSIFCIKTETYIKILLDNSLYVDSFDEVPLNKYAWKNNMKHLFVKNGFAIHMYYNWKNNHMEYERQFCNDFFN